jgi:outer membrane protein OmpA-like peptidoglycan-associated protein
VLLPGQEIEIRDKVYFGEGTWKIGEHNDVLLQSIVRALHAHPRIALLAVQGHATSIERMPQRLSEKRAHVVMDALIALGVKSTRLTSRGYGRTKPLKLGTSAEARAHNRRVEFQILKSSEEPVERAQPSPEPVPGCPER